MFFLSNKVGPDQDPEVSKQGLHDNKNNPAQSGICRICLEDDVKLIRPCKCNGSIEYVHEKCMISWIQRQRKIQRIQLKCQICLNPIRFSISSHLEWRPQKFIENIDKLNPCYIALFLACIIIIVIFSIILKYGSQDFLQSVGKVVVIGGLAVMSICFLGVVIVIIGTLVTEKVQKIERVFDIKQLTGSQENEQAGNNVQGDISGNVIHHSSGSSSSIQSSVQASSSS